MFRIWSTLLKDVEGLIRQMIMSIPTWC